jgi:3-deoxy-D-manno-octulosonate 8-phosphate phosphatase (KDO 8-P phosphatase)
MNDQLRFKGERMLERLRTDLVRKLTPIKLLIINADGLLTENHYNVKNQGPKNGDAVGALRNLGVKIEGFSVRKSETIFSTGSRLGIEPLYQGISQKTQLYYKIKAKHLISDGEVAFVGGDFSDLPIIEKAGFSAAPSDAALGVKAASYYVTYGNGEGAVIEVAELILKAKNHFGEMFE